MKIPRTWNGYRIATIVDALVAISLGHRRRSDGSGSAEIRRAADDQTISAEMLAELADAGLARLDCSGALARWGLTHLGGLALALYDQGQRDKAGRHE